jgi:hypothetical protein
VKWVSKNNCNWKTSDIDFIVWLEIEKKILYDFREIENNKKVYFYYNIEEVNINELIREYYNSKFCTFLERKKTLLTEVKNHEIVNN